MNEEEKIKDFLKFCAVGYSEDKGISFEGNPFFFAIRLIILIAIVINVYNMKNKARFFLFSSFFINKYYH